MKVFLISTILFSFLMAVIFAAEEKMNEEKMKAVVECKEQEKATDEDVQAYITHRLQQSRPGKCLLACIYEKSGTIKDGKIEESAVKERLVSEIGEKPFIDEIVTECQTVTNADRCELAAQFNECVHKALAARHDTNGPKKP